MIHPKPCFNNRRLTSGVTPRPIHPIHPIGPPPGPSKTAAQRAPLAPRSASAAAPWRDARHRWPFGRIDGPTWNKPHLNQCHPVPSTFHQTTLKRTPMPTGRKISRRSGNRPGTHLWAPGKPEIPRGLSRNRCGQPKIRTEVELLAKII